MTTLTLSSTPRSRERLVGEEPLGADGRPCPASAAFPYSFEDRAPSMLTDRELNYLHWLTAREYRGQGRIVELGCYLGGSTAALVDGLAHNQHDGSRVLTYDAFIMDEWSNSFLETPFRPGESFRPLFDRHQRHRLDRLTVREGRIPEDIPRDAERELYPEQEPIEILFVDAAKTRPLHDTVLRCFGRHLIPGRSVLVQQDFKDPIPYWIPLEMYRFRSCFEPLDSIPRSCTVSFRYRGGIESYLAEPEQPPPPGPDEIDAVWDEIETFWRPYPSPPMLHHNRLHRLSHHFNVGFYDRALAAADRFSCDFDPCACGSDGRPIVHAWRCTLAVIRWQLEQLGDTVDPAVGRSFDRLRSRLLRGEEKPSAWSREMSGAPRPTALLCERLWRPVAERCRARGWHRIALYGAGQHTRKLLAGGWPHGLLEVACVLDDNAAGVELTGVRVVDPHEATRDFDAIVLSSDVHETTLAARARALFGAAGVPVVRVYTEGDGP